MSYSIERRIQFCAGHRVYGHESKCATIHGHNYVAYVHARPKQGLDPIGRVIDFSVLKELVGGWIDKNWDHNFIVYANDLEVLKMASTISRKKDPYVMGVNPTAENMANFLLKAICPELFKDYQIEVWKVVLYETENCSAEATLV